LLITDITTIKLNYDNAEPLADAIHYMPSRGTVIVQVHTDDGIVGLGEAASYGGPPESTETVILKELAPRLIGQDPFRVEKLWQLMHAPSHQHGRRGVQQKSSKSQDSHSIATPRLVGPKMTTPRWFASGVSML